MVVVAPTPAVLLGTGLITADGATWCVGGADPGFGPTCFSSRVGGRDTSLSGSTTAPLLPPLPVQAPPPSPSSSHSSGPYLAAAAALTWITEPLARLKLPSMWVEGSTASEGGGGCCAARLVSTGAWQPSRLLGRWCWGCCHCWSGGTVCDWKVFGGAQAEKHGAAAKRGCSGPAGPQTPWCGALKWLGKVGVLPVR